MRKAADAASVPFADSAMDTASAAPLPGLAVGSKPAPGLTGPKGLSPRTNYSRVNTGSPLQVDAGATSQKSMPPDNQNFLPPKIAHREVPMSGTSTHRQTINEMLKAAAQGTLDQANISLEAERQAANRGAPSAVKTASAQPEATNSIPTDYVEKLACACEYMLVELQDTALQEKAAAELGPGTGPNPMQVLEAKSEGNAFKSGDQGQATPAHVVPKNPGTHKPAETPAGPATALDTNAGKAVSGTQKTSSVTVEELRKVAAFPAAFLAKKDDKEDKKDPKDKGKEESKKESKDKDEDKGEKKEASAVDPRLVSYFLSMTKSAEDAINPAKIAAGAAVPPDTSAAGESGGAPAGGKPQGPTGLIGTNEAAINYTKGQAKAQVKPQLGVLLTEPALSAAHDTTLGKAFANTGAAGVKISSIRSAAARAVVEKMAEACGTPKDKKKVSAGMGNFTAPPVSGAATGAM